MGSERLTSQPQHPAVDEDITIPSTPPPNRSTPLGCASLTAQVTTYENTSPVSPAPLSADMTPPPSAQAARSIHSPTRKSLGDGVSTLPASPPATVQTRAFESSSGISEDLPNPNRIAHATEHELRAMVDTLIPALREARVAAAHCKFQYSMLGMEAEQTAQRAKVEHEMEMREAEVLREVEYQRRNALVSPYGSSSSRIDILIRHCKELEITNTSLEQRLQKAKKFICYQQDQNGVLMEENDLLRQRIKDNREHINRLRASGGLIAKNTYRNDAPVSHRRHMPRLPTNARPNQVNVSRGGNQDPFAALLAADQVLNGDTSSVPSTPAQNHNTKAYTSHVHINHVRGSQSLSSLPATPSQPKPIVTDGTIFTPVNCTTTIDDRFSYSAPVSQILSQQRERVREDRDSTISLSDRDEEAVTDDDNQASQASQVASNMLRRDLNQRSSSFGSPKNVGSSNHLLQSKLFGQVKKPGLGRHDKAEKRNLDFSDEHSIQAKKARMQEGIGLGISG
ncbi:MAG: hypothetical protein M1834_000096 [Cirrosporium novae-zelandiae]|nr:MAG: hypothetical protein M1834_000096 [Cirrosporium novae-zelandiae]